MQTITERHTIRAITTHYIDGEFVESHGREVMDIINPTNGEVIAHVTLADEEDTRRAIAAAKRAFGSFGRTTKEERAKVLGRLHEAVFARIDDLTAAMVEEYGGTAVFSRLIMEAAANVLQSAANDELGQDDGHAGAGRRCWADYPLERELVFPFRQARLDRRCRLYRSHQAQ
jgi:acyl-CoA reductase-like NAD-dependent aldehyde dehydrogenase